MVKQVRVNLTIDKEVVEKAKEMGLNLSKTFEICLKQRIEALSALEGKTMTNGGYVDARSASHRGEWCSGLDSNLGLNSWRSGVKMTLPISGISIRWGS